jgi:hypothetical protein
MLTIHSARALRARLNAKFGFGPPAMWFRWLVMFTGIAVVVSGCKMM